METSIIIRVKNEKKNLQKLFNILKLQTYQNFEIIIVDNNSTDGSKEMVMDYFPKNRTKIVNINNFTYPKACNLGAQYAKGKFLVYLSAHSYPVTKTWLEDGLNNFKDDMVAGVFAFPIPGKDSTIAEKISGFPNKIRSGGYLGNTNSIIRRDLWEKHNFNESLIEGSEDYEWSVYFTKEGLKIINDPKFRVNHSHGLSILEIIKQHKKWNQQKKEINKKFQN